MKIGSLFSGIGGLELGLEWAGLGETVWQVEIDAGCREVLAKHWPEATRYENVCDVGAATLAPVDLICGGFPCQDVSSAGKRAGLGGARSGLWAEFRRVVSELRPRWVVVENVAGGAAGWVDRVAQGLARLGYQVLPVPLAAADVGAPHGRARVFLIAHVDGQELRQQSRRRSRSRGAHTAVAAVAGQAWAAIPNTDRARREGPSSDADQGRAQSSARGWRTPIPDVLRVVHGLSSGMDQANARPRIAALGNSVVPQCAEVIGHVIQILHAKHPRTT